MKKKNSELDKYPFFVVNPDNVAWLRIDEATPQERRKLFSLKGAIFMGCFLSLFVIAGILITTLLIYQTYVQIQLQFNSATTRGEFVSQYIDSDDDGDSYWVTYSYVVDDRNYTTTESVSTDFYNKADNGEPYRVIYSKNDPTIATVQADDWGLIIFLGIFCIFWNGFLVLIFWSIVSHGKKQRLLAQKGFLIDGEIVKISGSTDSEGDYGISIEYRFRSPETQEIVARNLWQNRADLKNQVIPDAPLPIKIVFLTNDNYKVV